MAARTKSKVTPKYEWHAYKHQTSSKYWSWRKLQLAIDGDTADGAYDTRAIYEGLATSGATEPHIVVPPKRTATVDAGAVGPWRQRNAAIHRIAEAGRRQWRKESGAHQQARAENAMFRFKGIIGDRLRSRSPEQQQTEAMIAVNILNRMTTLGMPESVAVRA